MKFGKKIRILKLNYRDITPFRFLGYAMNLNNIALRTLKFLALFLPLSPFVQWYS
jgi:hypothetical protein